MITRYRKLDISEYPGENSLWLRAWTACFQTRFIRTTQADFVLHYPQYAKWFRYQSDVVPRWKIKW